MTETQLREQDLRAFTDGVVAYHMSFGKDFWRLLWSAVRELGARSSVTPERLAALADLPLEQTLAVARSAWEWDPRGQRLVGAGLTGTRTDYRVDIDGRTRWTYCAADTLQLPAMLGKPVHTHSLCAATGALIRLHATPTGLDSLDPPRALMSFPDTSSRPSLANLTQMGCHQSRFYRDADSATEWLAANPHGELLPVGDAFQALHTSMRRIEEWFTPRLGQLPETPTVPSSPRSAK